MHAQAPSTFKQEQLITPQLDNEISPEPLQSSEWVESVAVLSHYHRAPLFQS